MKFSKNLFYGYGFDTPMGGQAICGGVFGELIKLAFAALLVGDGLGKNTVKHYQSDLFHDALWLTEHVDGPTQFYFGFDDCGTAIGTEEHLVSIARKNVFMVELEGVNNGRWTVTFSLVKGEVTQDA